MPHDQDKARKNAKTDLKRADGVSPPTPFGELITADHNILNINDESKSDHIMRKQKMRQKQHRACGDFIFISKARKSLQRQTDHQHLTKRVKTCNGITMPILLIVQKTTGPQKELRVSTLRCVSTGVSLSSYRDSFLCDLVRMSFDFPIAKSQARAPSLCFFSTLNEKDFHQRRC